MAKRFTFRLDPLLKLRSHKSSEAKEALNHVLRAKIEKEMIISEKTNYYQDFVRIGVKPKTAADFQAYYHHKNFVREEIDKLENDKIQIIEIENYRRAKLSEAMQAEKIIDKLKEKKIIAHREESDREERQFLDEIAIRRHDPSEILE